MDDSDAYEPAGPPECPPGCEADPAHGRARLEQAGLRPTRQRLLIHDLLFGDGEHRHVTAEMVHGDAAAAGLPVSLATVYNTLHQFREAGLVRQIPVDAGRTYFDTNTSDHIHFFDEHSTWLSDGPGPAPVHGLKAPDGFEIAGIDMIVRLRPRTKSSGDGSV